MLPVLTTLEMQMADRKAVEQLHISETRLMELAGHECVRIIRETLRLKSLAGTSFLVVCGKGNNGGDGFVITRHLLNFEASVDLILLYPDSLLQDVNQEGLAILEAYTEHNTNLRIFKSYGEALPFVSESLYEALIDAISGTGLRLTEQEMALASPINEGIELINALRDRTNTLTFAVDVPSGLDATTGFSATPSIRADVTVTMAFLKTGFYLNDGPECCGEIHVAEISIPRFLVDPTSSMLIDQDFAAEQFILREAASAKHTNGKVLIIAGSQTSQSSMLGAAILSVKAALKTGAGYLCVSLPISLADVMHIALHEAVVIGRDISAIAEKARWADVIMIGCGIGRDKSAIDFMAELLNCSDITTKKLILDADALYALSCIGMSDALSRCSNVVLTPHYGEFSRLGDIPIEKIAADPIETAKNFARKYGVTLLLKGNPTIIAGSEGQVLINTSGTEALASAGSGDVLSGMISALAAKGSDLFNAAGAAAWFHGRAGDLAQDVASLVSSGMVVDAIPQAIQEIFETEQE
ncbi:MAG: NAD(P)H-hydrate dehydratase [Chlorobiaceae bacterium]|nr:NAD(P)H-hydrate dehydratase [Chlorobiaceae bacterium]NTV16528.1 NAD(P)H-hydrate dehydratase [Chlorobiaceae bacterium]